MSKQEAQPNSELNSQAKSLGNATGWRIGLHIEPCMAEITALQMQDGKIKSTLSRRWYSPKVTLHDGVQQFLSTYPEITEKKIALSTSYTRQILEKKMGESPALLVTHGFENWVYLRQPLQKQGMSTSAARAPSPLSADLIFGITERTSPEGEIETPLAQEEIDFLISKLQFSGVKTVAIGLLHSNKNNTNEKQVAHKLKENGFKVFCSSEVGGAGSNEVGRWLRTFLCGYMDAPLTEMTKHLLALNETHGLEFLNKDLSDARELLRQEEALLGEFEGPVLWAGYDRWSLFEPSPIEETLETAYGPIATEKIKVTDLSIQPQQEVGMSVWGHADYLNTKGDAEVGPLAFGRSLKLTALDILLLHSAPDISEVEGLTKLHLDKVSNQIQMLAKTSKIDADTVKNYLTTKLSHVFRHATQDRKLTLAGPLAMTVQSLLLPSSPHSIATGTTSFALAKWGFRRD